MRNTCCCFLLLICTCCFAQTNTKDSTQRNNQTKNKNDNGGIGIGIKFGLNFANVTNAASINSGSQTGFHAGIFISPFTKSILSSHTEIIFSRQGYNYTTDSSSGSVKLNY